MNAATHYLVMAGSYAAPAYYVAHDDPDDPDCYVSVAGGYASILDAVTRATQQGIRLQTTADGEAVTIDVRVGDPADAQGLTPRRRGRPPVEDEPRSATHRIRCTPSALERWRVAADADSDGRDLAEVTRDLLDAWAEQVLG